MNGELPPFTLVKGRYEVGRVLGRGGFGITYAGRDRKLNKICAIKEYMPQNYAYRGQNRTIFPRNKDEAQRIFAKGKKGFLKEAENLKRLSDLPTVVDCYDYFCENNTAYLVMERLEGKDLSALAREKGGKIPPSELYPLFLSVARTMVDVHKRGIAHRDISPDNIFYTNDGRVVLIDFGAARDYVNSFANGMSVLLKRNYAPPEQYTRMGNQGPWSDVYSLCATYYRLVSGTVADVSPYGKAKTLRERNAPVSQLISNVIAKGLEPEPKNRYQDFVMLLEALGESEDSVGMPTFPLPAKQFHLIQYRHTLPQSDRLIENGKIRIGRDPTHEVVIEEGHVSRDHCVLERKGDELYLTDVSKHGTFWKDGERLTKYKRYPITSGCEFYVYIPEYSFSVSQKGQTKQTAVGAKI